MARNLKKGFTLLEILMVVAIGAIITTIVTLSFAKLNAEQALDKSATNIVSVLNEARSLTLSSSDAAQYGVHFDPTQVVLFKGGSYSSSDSSNIVTPLNSKVNLRNIMLAGGGSDVTFKRLTGGTTQSGTLEVFLKEATTSFHTITITLTGVAADN